MKIHYSCDSCGDAIDTIELDQLDETRLGFDCLTSEERQEIVRYDDLTGVLYVQSLCDACIEAMGLAVEFGPVSTEKGRLH